MNLIKEKYIPPRNITPNFIRYKRSHWLMQVKIVMGSHPYRNKIIRQVSRNEALLKLAVAHLKSTKNEFSISVN